MRDLTDPAVGVLSGNPIRRRIKMETGINSFEGITYGLQAKECYTDTQRGVESYLEPYKHC